MKKIKLLMIFSLLAFAGQAKPKKPGVIVLSRNYDIFYFRVNKKQIGGDVKVFNEKNTLIAEKHLESKQNIIDFFEAPPGKYTIRIESKEGQKNFHYSKGKNVSKISIPTPTGEEIISAASK